MSDDTDFISNLRVSKETLLKAKEIDENMYRRLIEINNMLRDKTFNLNNDKDLILIESIIEEMNKYFRIIDEYERRSLSKLVRPEKKKSRKPY